MLRSDPAPPLADGKKANSGPRGKAIDQVHYLIPGSVHDSHVLRGWIVAQSWCSAREIGGSEDDDVTQVISIPRNWINMATRLIQKKKIAVKHVSATLFQHSESGC